MKKIINAVIVGVIVIITSCYILHNVYQLIANKKESDKTLQKVYEIISNDKEKNKKNYFAENSENKANEIDEVNEETQEKGQINNTNETNIEDKNVKKINNNDLPNIVQAEGIIGIISIPKINVTAPVKEGTSQEVMRTCVGHFTESNYWNGNVSLASHNGGTNAHYFENINKLKEGDEIEYTTVLGKKKYKVSKISKIESTDWTEIYGNSQTDNTNAITLITCIDYLPNYRLCVKGVE